MSDTARETSAATLGSWISTGNSTAGLRATRLCGRLEWRRGRLAILPLCRSPVIAAQTRGATAIDLKPILGKVIELALKAELRIVLRCRHHVAGPRGTIGIVERCVVDVARQHAIDFASTTG